MSEDIVKVLEEVKETCERLQHHGYNDVSANIKEVSIKLKNNVKSVEIVTDE